MKYSTQLVVTFLVTIVLCSIATGTTLYPAASATYQNKNIWRGQVVGNDPTVDTGFDFTYGKVSASAIGIMDMSGEDKGQFASVDYTLTYTDYLAGTWDWRYSVGVIYYDYLGSHGEDTAEVFAAVGYAGVLKPAVAAYWDVLEAHSLYLQGSLEHTVQVFGQDVVFGATIGWGNKNYDQYFWNSGAHRGSQQVSTSVTSDVTVSVPVTTSVTTTTTTTTTTPGTPGSPAIPATPGTPAIPATPGTPYVPAVPGTPYIPAVPPTVGNGNAHGQTGGNGNSGNGNGNGNAYGQNGRNNNGTQGNPGGNGNSGNSNGQGLSHPGSPAVPATPGTPAIPATPGTPGTPATPGTPGTPAVPATPDGVATVSTTETTTETTTSIETKSVETTSISRSGDDCGSGSWQDLALSVRAPIMLSRNVMLVPQLSYIQLLDRDLKSRSSLSMRRDNLVFTVGLRFDF